MLYYMYKLRARVNKMNKRKGVTRRNPVASELRTPKYRMRVVVSKLHKQVKHKGQRDY